MKYFVDKGTERGNPLCFFITQSIEGFHITKKRGKMAVLHIGPPAHFTSSWRVTI